jgi:hypothetical protein
VESKEAILKSLREDEQRLRELAELVAPDLRDRVENILKNVRSRISIVELRQDATATDKAAGVRKEARTAVEITVCIRGMDANGRLYNELATTADVTTTGARLRDVYVPLHRGCIMNIQREHSRADPARYRVMWVGEDQVGVQLMDAGRHIWGQPLARQMGDAYESKLTEQE